MPTRASAAAPAAHRSLSLESGTRLLLKRWSSLTRRAPAFQSHPVAHDASLVSLNSATGILSPEAGASAKNATETRSRSCEGRPPLSSSGGGLLYSTCSRAQHLSPRSPLNAAATLEESARWSMFGLPPQRKPRNHLGPSPVTRARRASGGPPVREGLVQTFSRMASAPCMGMPEPLLRADSRRGVVSPPRYPIERTVSSKRHPTQRCKFCAQSLGRRDALSHARYCPLKPSQCNLVDTETGDVCNHFCRGEDKLILHQKRCLFRTRVCGNIQCGRPVSIRSVGRHKAVCEFKSLACSECGQSFPRHSEGKHQLTCPAATVECPLRCGRRMKRADVPQHILTEAMNHESTPPPGVADLGVDHPLVAAFLLLHLLKEQERGGDGMRPDEGGHWLASLSRPRAEQGNSDRINGPNASSDEDTSEVISIVGCLADRRTDRVTTESAEGARQVGAGYPSEGVYRVIVSTGAAPAIELGTTEPLGTSRPLRQEAPTGPTATPDEWGEQKPDVPSPSSPSSSSSSSDSPRWEPSRVPSERRARNSLPPASKVVHQYVSYTGGSSPSKRSLGLPPRSPSKTWGHESSSGYQHLLSNSSNTLTRADDLDASGSWRRSDVIGPLGGRMAWSLSHSGQFPEDTQRSMWTAREKGGNSTAAAESVAPTDANAPVTTPVRSGRTAQGKRVAGTPKGSRLGGNGKSSKPAAQRPSFTAATCARPHRAQPKASPGMSEKRSGATAMALKGTSNGISPSAPTASLSQSPTDTSGDIKQASVLLVKDLTRLQEELENLSQELRTANVDALEGAEKDIASSCLEGHVERMDNEVKEVQKRVDAIIKGDSDPDFNVVFTVLEHWRKLDSSWYALKLLFYDAIYA